MKWLGPIATAGSSSFLLARFVEILSAQANGVTLLVLALLILFEARPPADRSAATSRAGSCSSSRSSAWPSTSSRPGCSPRQPREPQRRGLRSSTSSPTSTRFIAHGDRGRGRALDGLAARRRDRLAARRRADAARRLRPPARLGPDLPRGRAERPRPGRDRPDAGRAVVRDRGARPARLGDLVGLPRAHRARARRRPTATATRPADGSRTCSTSASASATRRCRSTMRQPPQTLQIASRADAPAERP